MRQKVIWCLKKLELEIEMDWSRAKTILIIAMLLTNFLLVKAYYGKSTDETLTKEYIEETEKLLSEAGIGLKVKIPDKTKRIICPYVSRQILYPEKINEAFFKAQAESVEVDEKTTVLSHGSETVEITDNERFIYTNSAPNIPIEDFNENTSLQAAKNFLKERGIFPSDAVWELTINSGDNYKVIFAAYDMVSGVGVKLEDSFLEVVVSSKGVIRATKSWLEISENGEKSTVLNTAPKALRSLPGDRTLFGKSIVKIDICCYWDSFDLESEKKISSVRGMTNPAWRVLFSDGEERILKSR